MFVTMATFQARLQYFCAEIARDAVKSNKVEKSNLIIVSIYIVWTKITTIPPSQGTLIDIVSGNHALLAQPTD